MADSSSLVRSSLDSVDNRFSDTTVIDVDVHVTYTEELQHEVAKTMPKPWANYVDPEVTTNASHRRPASGIPKMVGGVKEFEIADASKPEIIHQHLCQGLGIDHPLLNVLDRSDQVWKTDRAIAETRGVNQMLLDRFLDEYDEFLGAASISLRDPARMAEMIDDLGNEDQIVAGMIYSGTEHQMPPGDPKYDIMYEAMAENGIHPLFHTGAFLNSAPWLKKFETAFSWHSLAPAWSVQQAVVSLIAQGTPEKFPELNFIMVEGGLGWIPYLMGRLNREHAQWLPEVSILEKSPEEYIRDQFYFSTQPLEEFNDPNDMKRVLEIIGADSLLFATDYPHYDFDDPSTLDRFLGEFSTEEREKILHGNASEIFGLDV